jgi:hypothetical protein
MCEYMELQLCFERGFMCVLHQAKYVKPSKKKILHSAEPNYQ